MFLGCELPYIKQQIGFIQLILMSIKEFNSLRCKSSDQSDSRESQCQHICEFLHYNTVYVLCINTSEAWESTVYLQDMEYNLFFPDELCEEHPEALKDAHHQRCRPRALSHLPQLLWAEASDSRSETSRCDERSQKTGRQAAHWHRNPWYHRLVSNNAPSALLFFFFFHFHFGSKKDEAGKISNFSSDGNLMWAKWSTPSDFSINFTLASCIWGDTLSHHRVEETIGLEVC